MSFRSSGYFLGDLRSGHGLVGTKGYIELRKYTEVAAENPEGEQLYLVDGEKEHRISCAGKVGYPFFGQLILDSLNRTESAMTQAHAFKAAELCLLTQNAAKILA